jgi:hypothetical protein
VLKTTLVWVTSSLLSHFSSLALLLGCTRVAAGSAYGNVI